MPGAEASAPVIHVSLRVRGVEFSALRVAVTRLEQQRPLLLGMDVLSELFAAGFAIAR